MPSRPSERTASVPRDIAVRHVDLDGNERHFWESREKDGQWGTPRYYLDHVGELPHRLAGALEEIARAPTGGILFHCGAGWDRTGLLAAVLLKAAGVTEDAATRDYLSSFANAVAMAELHSRSFDVAERLSVLDRFGHTPESAFRDMYRREFVTAKRLRAEDHTGQLDKDERLDREDRFKCDWWLDPDTKKQRDEEKIRTQAISCLFCSPTMELGVDIGGLSVVHLRNAPPNSASYAQRSGRAGRSGQGALVFTYCSGFSAHDRHFFQDQAELVAGAVQPPRLDLFNRELLVTHLNALAISEIGLPSLDADGGSQATLKTLVDMEAPGMPLAFAVREGLTIPEKFGGFGELAEIETELSVTRAYLERCIFAMNDGDLNTVDAAKAKWWATELEQRVVTRCLQLHGGNGFLEDYPIGRAFRDSRVQSIYGGTTEIMKEIVARELFGR
jgi:hypothetical protein